MIIALLSALSSQGALAAFSCSSSYHSISLPRSFLRIIGGPFSICSTSMYSVSDCCLALCLYFSHLSCCNAIGVYHSFFRLSDSLSRFKAALPPWMFQGCAFHWCGLHRHSSHLYVHYTVCCCYVFLLTSTWMAIQPATFTE